MITAALVTTSANIFEIFSTRYSLVYSFYLGIEIILCVFVEVFYSFILYPPWFLVLARLGVFFHIVSKFIFCLTQFSLN